MLLAAYLPLSSPSQPGTLTDKQIPQYDEVEYQEAGAAYDDGRPHRHPPPAAALVPHHGRVS